MKEANAVSTWVKDAKRKRITAEKNHFFVSDFENFTVAYNPAEKGMRLTAEGVDVHSPWYDPLRGINAMRKQATAAEVLSKRRSVVLYKKYMTAKGVMIRKRAAIHSTERPILLKDTVIT